ncbi:hypothetical protein [Aureibacter tunicatorum]|uniref:PKD family protein n=1 Tax=Aureibacter tunicatorum TaxID=866807 RepID=A0AAE3XNK8_9BACT|nr:hypothetical protein [Aureibacter tunicatorum]MDR6239189.1 hypothetical protein [Aureibacter tunicatorum]BDD04885.1 hypothetical protein AUTU_23680 [Aureibacter tunicatorum]
MKKIAYILISFSLIWLISCSNYEIPGLSPVIDVIEPEGGFRYKVGGGEPLVLKPTVTSELQPVAYDWRYVDSLNSLSDAPQYSFTTEIPNEYRLRFRATSEAGFSDYIYNILAYGKYAFGIYLVGFDNSMNTILGFREEGESTDFEWGVYKQENDRTLPSKSEGFFLLGENYYFYGQGDPYVQIANRHSLKMVAGTPDGVNADNYPLGMVTIDTLRGYISTPNGLYNYDVKENSLNDRIQVIPRANELFLSSNTQNLFVNGGTTMENYSTVNDNVVSTVVINDFIDYSGDIYAIDQEVTGSRNIWMVVSNGDTSTIGRYVTATSNNTFDNLYGISNDYPVSEDMAFYAYSTTSVFFNSGTNLFHYRGTEESLAEPIFDIATIDPSASRITAFVISSDDTDRLFISWKKTSSGGGLLLYDLITNRPVSGYTFDLDYPSSEIVIF